jgi:SAM-dependent MidA family methyltransferase
VVKILQPDKLFDKEAEKEMKPGDTFELCYEAVSWMQKICSLVELTKGAALIVDYGEDHAFANSFRGIKNHQLIKDWDRIIKLVGTLDLTAYVNF